ncbi:MAG: molybdopterin-dependent oxidoreductase [Candidatus Binatia bacterium]|nr:molybdopterin-dependent oxidoreductase [Candidatus Binatia bacterium]
MSNAAIEIGNGRRVKRTLCHGCTRRCGLLVTLENGEIVDFKGDPDQPMSQKFYCPRGKALVTEQPFDKYRLRHPMKRAGERGEGKWERISWGQALDEIAGKLRKIIEKDGPESVAATLDCAITTTGASTRFMKELGSPNWFTLGGQVCYANSFKIEDITYGQDTVCDRANSKCTVIWGCNPNISKPEWFRHIMESKKRGGKVIAVDPYRTKSVDIADLWLQIRPGSDGAMMLAWLNVIIDEGLYDTAFVEKWTNAPYLVGLESRKILRQSDVVSGGDPKMFLAWDPAARKPVAFDLGSLSYETQGVKPPLKGTFEVRLADGSTQMCTTVWELLCREAESYSPERAEEITWVPAEKIREAARIFTANTPGNIFPGFALDGLGTDSNQAGRARSILNALAGNLDVKGGQVMLGPFPEVRSDSGNLSDDQAAKVLGGDRYRVWTQEASLKLYEFQKRVGFPYPSYFYGAHAPTVWRAMLTEEPYPVKAFLIIGSNPIVSAANSKLVEKAMQELDLIVCQDMYMTPTAELADYVTPAASDDIENCRLYTGGPGTGWLEGHSLLSGERAVDPPGDARSDFEFVRELGVRLGQNWPWENDEEYYDWQLEPLGFSSFKEFHKEVQYSVPEPTYKKYEERGFGTPSGKVEIYSSFLENLGYAPLPHYEEPPNSPIRTPDLWKEYPYVQCVMRLRYYYQTSHRNLPSLREKLPDPLCHMHPDTATAHGLEEGDWVWIESPVSQHRIKQKVKIFDGLDPRVIFPEFGWWFPEKSAEEGLHGAWESNINVLTQDDPEICCPMIGSWYMNANLLKLSKV